MTTTVAKQFENDFVTVELFRLNKDFCIKTELYCSGTLMFIAMIQINRKDAVGSFNYIISLLNANKNALAACNAALKYMVNLTVEEQNPV
jgi:hypothetical protein